MCGGAGKRFTSFLEQYNNKPFTSFPEQLGATNIIKFTDFNQINKNTIVKKVELNINLKCDLASFQKRLRTNFEIYGIIVSS